MSTERALRNGIIARIEPVDKRPQRQEIELARILANIQAAHDMLQDTPIAVLNAASAF